MPSKITGVTKEVRPVFSEELRFLGLDRDYGWDFPDCEGPLMWAEARRYFYKGELVCEASGGGLYEMPTLKNVIKDLRITPVDIEMMLSKNESVMDGLVQKTLKTTYKAYLDYKSRVSMFYVAYSGGKDSIVMLDIVQRALPHDGFVVVFGDTTMELKTTYQALSEAKAHWPSLEWYEARAEFEAEESWRRIGFPARKLRWCCSVHKTAPSIAKLKEIYKTKYPEAQRPFKVMVFDGVRAEESDARSTYTMISDGNKHAVQFNCSPILEWSSCELFLYIFKYGLLFNNVDLDTAFIQTISHYNNFAPLCDDPTNKQLGDRRRRVLKVTLLLAALQAKNGAEARTGATSLMRPTLVNIKACFAGTPQESTVEQDLNYFASKGIVGKIESAKEVLFVMTSAAIDTERMNQIIDETRKAITFEKLVADSTYDVAKQFMPTDYLKWRMRIINVSPANAKQEAEKVDKSENHIPTFFLFAKNEADQGKIKDTVTAIFDKVGERCIVVDFSSLPFTDALFSKFIESKAKEKYFSTIPNQKSQLELAKKTSQEVLNEWTRKLITTSLYIATD